MIGINIDFLGTYYFGVTTNMLGGAMFSLKLPQPLYDRLYNAAQRERRSMAFVVRDALEAHLSAISDTHNLGGEITRSPEGPGSN